MFRRLSTKLTVLYAGMFAAALLLVAGAVYTAVADNAERIVQQEMEASGGVFDRVWQLRSTQLIDSADVLARDFGFREAVATGDEATIGSALENLKNRLGIDIAFMVDLDGRFVGVEPKTLDAGGEALWNAVYGEESASGVLMIGGVPYQAISTPILSPVPSGWLVFAVRLDGKEMKSLEALSAIPLRAEVLHRDSKGAWAGAAGPTARLIDKALAAKNLRPIEIAGAEGAALALVKPLKGLGEGQPAVLMLRYPLAAALAPYRTLLWTVVATGLTGLLLLGFGSWALARTITRPISALDDAAHRLQRGEGAQVRVETADEIGRLADSFNAMAAAIRQREHKITHLALTDADTGLPNRLALERETARLIGEAKGAQVMVAALGVDRFQQVRGAIGYELASRLLGEVGRRLSALDPDSRVARLASDTLGLAFTSASLKAASAKLSELQAALEEPVTLDDNLVDVRLTVGLAAYGDHARDVSGLVERAMIGLDQAREGRRRIGQFDQAAYGDPAGNLSLISELVGAISKGELFVHHQPKLDLRAGSITGIEALVRWRHPRRGIMAPDLFIAMAEETGHIRPLTEFVLARAIEDQLTLRAAGHDLCVSVNISGRLMNDPEFAQAAIDLVRSSGAKACFEITETAVIDNPDLALKLLDQFVRAGIAISIDDYGAGLSSLTYLKQIRADELKIDKSFVLALEEGQRDALLVKSTIDLAHSLGLKVTAEGVETPTALALLTAMGCDLAQGYLIAKPMPLAELSEFLGRQPAAAKTHRALGG